MVWVRALETSPSAPAAKHGNRSDLGVKCAYVNTTTVDIICTGVVLGMATGERLFFIPDRWGAYASYPGVFGQV